MSEPYLICGIDGGGTSAKCALSDGKTIIATSKRGSSNIYAVGFETAFENVKRGIEDCLLTLSKYPSDLKIIHLASAGLGNDENKKAFIKALSSTFINAKVGVSDDAYPLFWSSGLDGNGVVAISGTGSIALGLSGEGEMIRSGGYGWRLGDEGSAYHIAYEAIRRAVRGSEMLESDTMLINDMLSFFNFSSIKDAIYFMNSEKTTKSMVADFAPIVFERAYHDNDAVAISIIESELNEFIRYISSVISRLKGTFKHTILLSGGLIDNSCEYRDSLIKKLKLIYPSYEVIQAEQGAAVKGCLKLASLLNQGLKL